MALAYVSRWETPTTNANFSSLSGLYSVSFSADGLWLGCCNAECVFILSAFDGSLKTRLWYPKKAAGILWPDMKGGSTPLVCAYEDGSIITLLNSGKVRCKI